MYTELSTGTYSPPDYTSWGNRIVSHIKRAYSIVPTKAFLVTKSNQVDVVVMFDHEIDGKKVQMKALYTINITTIGDQPDTIIGPVFNPPLIEAKTAKTDVSPQTTKLIKPVAHTGTQTIEKVNPFKRPNVIVDNKAHQKVKVNDVKYLVAKFNSMSTLRA